VKNAGPNIAPRLGKPSCASADSPALAQDGQGLTFGPDDPTVATDANNLGLVLQAQGDLAGAQAAYERALAILKRSLPAGHPHIRLVQENLASLQ
jgi:hypothetical protein